MTTNATPSADEENGSGKPEQNRELGHACETICGIAEATFEVLVTTAHSTSMAGPDGAQASPPPVTA